MDPKPTIAKMLTAFRDFNLRHPLPSGVPRVTTVVLTGAPCGGKSTFIQMAIAKLEKHGYHVVIVPEVARDLIAAGLHKNEGFQEKILLTILEREYSFLRDLDLIEIGDKPIAFLCDRGIMDGAAYAKDKDEYTALLRKVGIAPSLARDRYDMVIHLVTAADGAEAYYVTDTERRETIREARLLDTKIIGAWISHIHHAIINNTGDFGTKMNRALAALGRKLKMSESEQPIESELKFWVKNFSRNLIPGNAESSLIRQTYLLRPDRTGIECRVRKRWTNEGEEFFYTEKTKTEVEGERGESETPIDSETYAEYVRLYSDPACGEIMKERHKFVFGHRTFELDIYMVTPLEGLVVLEVELPDIAERFAVLVPPQFDLLDVTADLRFSNRILAEHGKPPEVC